MKLKRCLALCFSLLSQAEAFCQLCRVRPTENPLTFRMQQRVDECSRRQLLADAASSVVVATVSTCTCLPQEVNAAVGSLPELADTNVVVQGVTIKVADKSQQDAMIRFLTGAFDFEVLRKRIRGPIEETWLGYGPEQLSAPPAFVIPVSSFAKYGGHASIHLVYDSRITSPLYRTGESSPSGDNVAYLQVGVPGYRISQMTSNGGNILDAYGHVNVISPAGLPMRGIVGIAPDPIMFLAIYCADLKASKAFYEQVGFKEQEYPYARPSRGTGPFEPAQPPKSIYLAPSSSSMGVLLLPTKKKLLSPNPVVGSLNLVYAPSANFDPSNKLLDPSGIVLDLQPFDQFEVEEQETR